MWYLYILKCADDSLYTGITTNLKRRVDEHNNSKKASKYTRSRRPVRLIYSKKYPNRSKASKEEFLIKKLSQKEKNKIVYLQHN